jgi:hypothetical protein
VTPIPHLRTETDPVSEPLSILSYQAMNKIQKLSNPERRKKSNKKGNICFLLFYDAVSTNEPPESLTHSWS